MPRVPDAETARNALLSIRADLENALSRAAQEPPEPGATTILVGRMHEILVLASWSWGAALELSRSALPQATWEALQEASGVSDATLHNQLTAWRRKEATR